MPQIKINGDIADIKDDLLKNYIDESNKRTKLKKVLRYGAIGLHLLVPIVGWARLWSKTKTVYNGQLGVSRNTLTGEYIILPPGRHILLSPFHKYVRRVKTDTPTVAIGPYTIVTVKTGQIALTYKDGKQQILGEGRHLLDSATHIYHSHATIKEEVITLKNIRVNTEDNIPVHIEGDIFFQIDDPELACRSLEDIKNSVTERAENAIASVYNHHRLAEISPINFNSEATPPQPSLNLDANTTIKNKTAPPSLSSIVKEIIEALSANLKQVGIKLNRAGIKGMEICDKQLQHEMGTQAVTWTKTAAALQTAENNRKIELMRAETAAHITKMSAVAQAESTKITAQATAEATVVRAQGHVAAAKILEESPFAQQFEQWKAQKDIVGSAKTMIYPMSSVYQAPQVSLSAGTDLPKQTQVSLQ